MQDIAGCRVIVANVVHQERFVASLRTVFPGATVIDRRDKPSHGYRAVHIIAEISGKPVEIQVRTELQHRWAEISEKLSDVVDSAIKYGGGPDELRTVLANASQLVAAYEKKKTESLNDEAAYEKLLANYKNFTAEQLDTSLSDHEAQAIQDKLECMRDEIEATKKDIIESKVALAVEWNEIWNELRGFMGELNEGLFD
jgi:ppGpp synthetase/RelA/SpoT-type nucleotidyltranferase